MIYIHASTIMKKIEEIIQEFGLFHEYKYRKEVEDISITDANYFFIFESELEQSDFDNELTILFDNLCPYISASVIFELIWDYQSPKADRFYFRVKRKENIL